MTTDTTWRKSSRSGDQNACVEIARRSELARIRDSKSPQAGVLTFETANFNALLKTMKAE